LFFRWQRLLCTASLPCNFLVEIFAKFREACASWNQHLIINEFEYQPLSQKYLGKVASHVLVHDSAWLCIFFFKNKMFLNLHPDTFFNKVQVNPSLESVRTTNEGQDHRLMTNYHSPSSSRWCQVSQNNKIEARSRTGDKITCQGKVITL